MAAEYEKKEFKAETDSSEHNASHIPAYNHNEEYYDDGVETSRWTRMGVTPSSFKRRTLADKNNQLNRSLKSRHLHMIAIGGSIGAGFFVASGNALRTGGPGSLLICFAIIGIMMCKFAINCLGWLSDYGP